MGVNIKDNLKKAVLIPARCGSKRVPDKNIRLLSGIPLMNYSIITAKFLEIPVYVSTDSDQYAVIAESAGATVIKRPEAISGDDIDDSYVITHAYDYMDEPDIVLYLRPTTPFRRSDIVEKAINLFCNSIPFVTSLRSVEELPESVDKCFIKHLEYLIPITAATVDDAGKPNQHCRKTFKGNGYIDILWPEVFLEEDTLWGDKVIAYETPPTVEIDTEADWQYAEYIAYKEGGTDFVTFRRE